MIEIHGLECLYSDARTGWKSVPMWSITTRKDRKGYAEAELLSVYREFGVIRKSDRDDNHNVESEDLSSYKFVKKGDLVLNKMKTWQGSLGVSKFEGIVSPAYFVCELSPDVYGPFIHYLLRSDPYIAMYAAASKGIRVGQWDLPYEEFRALPVLLPPIEEQRRIADYLDEQILVLDRLKEMKAKELALRTESERRIIDDFLSPYAKIKLKYVCEDAGQYGLNITPEEYQADGIRLLRTSDFGSREVEPIYVSGPLEERYVVKEGDLLLTRSGTIGLSFLVGPEDAGSSYAGFLIRFRCKETYSPRFLSLVCKSTDFQEQVTIGATVSTIPNFNADKYANIKIPSLSKIEQVRLLQAIEKSTEKFSKLISPLLTTIALLDELKTSLITAAVTGQFDVTTGRSVA